MASIYNIPDWTSTLGPFVENDIVKHEGFYWYALRDVAKNVEPEHPSSNWGGVITAALSTHSAPPTSTKPYFFWKPSYGMSSANKPKVKSIQYGDGYEQRFKDGVFNNLLHINLNFDGRNEKEATAISHFLDSKAGVDDFFFVPPSPHQNIRKFICREWTTSMEFNDSYNISTGFEQVP